MKLCQVVSFALAIMFILSSVCLFMVVIDRSCGRHFHECLNVGKDIWHSVSKGVFIIISHILCSVVV